MVKKGRRLLQWHRRHHQESYLSTSRIFSNNTPTTHSCQAQNRIETLKGGLHVFLNIVNPQKIVSDGFLPCGFRQMFQNIAHRSPNFKGTFLLRSLLLQFLQLCLPIQTILLVSLAANLSQIWMIFLVKVTRTTTISKNSLIKKIPAEIQRQGLRKADDNCQHFTSFNAANAGPSRNNTGKNT